MNRISSSTRLAFFFLCLLTINLSSHLAGCSAATNKKVVRGVVDLALVLCIAEHPGEDMPKLKAICGFADDVEPIVKDLTAAQRRGEEAAKAKAAQGAGDAGVVDAGKDAK